MRTLLTVLALAVVLVASQALAATGTTVFGVKGGLSFTNVRGDSVVNTDSRTVGCFGGFVEIPINDMVSFQPELLYAMKGAKESCEEEGYEEESVLKLTYVEIPMLFKINVPMAGAVRPFLVVGPEVAFKVSAKFEDTVNGKTEKGDAEEVKGTDLGMIIGGGIGFPMMDRMAMLEARYDLGLTTIDDSPAKDDVKNNAISIMLGITF